MNRDDIIRMARDAGSIDSDEVIETLFMAFAAAEREECAKACEAKAGDKPADPAFGDARDAADYTEWEATTKAAAAIRARNAV